MKNMKTTSLFNRLFRVLLLTTSLTVGSLSSYAGFVKHVSFNTWGGSCDAPQRIGKYLQYELSNYRGEIVIEMESKLDALIKPDGISGWPSLEDEGNPNQLKVQVETGYTGKLCFSYDADANAVNIEKGPCGGVAIATPMTACKGGTVNFSVSESAADASKRWGVLSAANDTTWLDAYDDLDDFDYEVNEVTTMVLKYTTSTGLVSCSDVTVNLSLAACGESVTASATELCPGEEVTLTSSYKEGAKYEWKLTTGKVVATTTEPTLTFKPVTTNYDLYVDDLYAGSVSLKMNGCGFFVSPLYPITTCLQDSNYLYAIGDVMLADAKNPAFEWESSEDGETWTVIEGQNKFRLPVLPTEDTYYRAKYNSSYTAPFFYEVPNCAESDRCEGLQTRVLFYETFGFFVNENTYVSGDQIYDGEVILPGGVEAKSSSDSKGFAGNYSGDLGTDYIDKIHYPYVPFGTDANSKKNITGEGYYTAREDKGYSLVKTTEGQTSYHIQKFVTPDPNGHVVSASEFVRLPGGSSNQFVGTDGHLFLQANPMLPNYFGWGAGSDIDDAAFRLQDGYYAIVANPDSVDRHQHKDYSDITDATGNVNGAMLMVNSGQTNISKSAIYAQRVVLGCAADRFAFSMNVRNVAKQDGLNPVNISVLLLEDIAEVLPAEYKRMGAVEASHILNNDINSGDLPSGSSAQWTKVDKYVELGAGKKVKSLWVVLYNNGEPGDGNDMVIDDISFSVCLPKAELSANIDGELITGSLTVCDGRDVELVAKQKGDYIPDPVYLFQYFDKESNTWEDMKDYSDADTYKETNTTISVTEKKYLGDVPYRVIIGSTVEELRDVSENAEDVCNEFLVARSNIDVRNTFGGPMCADHNDEKVCFVAGDTVTVSGCRNLTNPDHTWKMLWKNDNGDVLVDTMEVTGVSSDDIHFVIDQDFNVTVYDRKWNKTFQTDSAGMANIYFVALDEGGCEHKQTFNLKAKHVVDLGFDKESAIGCDSVMVKISNDVPSATLRWDWGMPGREVIVDEVTRVFYPDGLDKVATITGTLKISVVNDGDQYCAPAEPLEIPFRVNNVSYKLKVVPSSNPVCVTPGQADDVILLQLEAAVEPAEAKKIITVYHWRMDFGDGDVIDTTSVTERLFLRYKDLHGRTGKSVRVDLISTETVDCGNIENDDANSGADIDIREGQFKLSLEAKNPNVCLNSEDVITLKAGISPKTALTNIDKFVLRDGTIDLFDIPTNLSDSVYEVTVDKAKYPEFFTAGTTKYFTLSAYDEYCKANSISEPTEVNLNGYTFKLEDPGMDGAECLVKGEKLTIEAKLSDPNADNLIKSYKWYKGNTLVHEGGLTYAFEVTESSNDYYKLVLSDKICEDVADSIQVAVSVKYDVTLSANKFTTCADNDSAKVRAVITPASSVLQIKRYEWHAVVAGEDIVIKNGNASDSVLVLSSENFPKLVAAGVSADIYVVAYDSICDPAKSKDDVHFDFNVPYEMTVNYDGKSVCVPSEGDINAHEVLLKVSVDITPAEALVQVHNYIWHIKSSDESVWNVYNTAENHIEFTYSDLKKYKGKDVKLYVSSYDDICAPGTDPNISDTVNVEIRVGGFDVDLNDIPTAYCVESLDDAKFTLKAVVTPADARNNISEFYWYDNGKIFATTEADSIVLDKNTYKDVFEAGYTANFSVAAFDAACERDTVRSNSSTKVEFNTRFELSLSYPSDKICLPADDKAVTLTAQTEPSSAINHIKEYVWERIAPSEKTTSTSENSLNLNTAGWLEVSDAMSFKVTAYDNVCYNKADGGSEFMDTLMVNKNFTPKLDVNYKFICSTEGSITSELTIDPKDAYVHTYTYKYIFRGKEYSIDEDVDLYKAKLLSSYFPEDMKSGEKFELFVEIDDSGVCGPIESDKVSVSVQNPFTLALTTDRDSACVNSLVEVKVVDINPSEAESFIKKITWYDNGSAITTAKDVQKIYGSSDLSVGEHLFYVVADDEICPAVTSEKRSVMVVDSLRLEFTPSTYTYCYPTDGQVSLHVNVVSGSPIRYELYDADTDEMLSGFNNRKPSAFWETEPTVDRNSYYVKVYDGVCSFNKSNAITSSTSIRVHVPVEFTLDIPQDMKEVCVGDSIKLSLSPISGYPSYYLVYGKTSETVQRILPTGEDLKIGDIAKEAGYLNYTVVAIDEICPSTSESEGSVFVHESPEIQLYANKENVIIGGDIVLYADPIKGSPTSYEWFCDGVSFAVTATNQTNYLPESTSEYVVRASDGVCPSATSSITLDVKLPTAFTPYVADDLNDKFMNGFNVVVFDRYGQKVFEGENGWDGRRGNSPSFVDPGVFFYQVVMKNGKVEKGTVEVVLNK